MKKKLTKEHKEFCKQFKKVLEALAALPMSENRCYITIEPPYAPNLCIGNENAHAFINDYLKADETTKSQSTISCVDL